MISLLSFILSSLKLHQILKMQESNILTYCNVCFMLQRFSIKKKSLLNSMKMYLLVSGYKSPFLLIKILALCTCGSTLNRWTDDLG